mmetsp:Transcript_65847/g.183457  ORF Transcript_65847/g.183457 Transcript_65847/m.183457 type:complete len:664 (+) Transcript_65847:142-2133(+)
MDRCHATGRLSGYGALACGSATAIVLLPAWAAKCLFVALVLFQALRALTDRLLGRLAGWAIGRTPKAFDWTIESICVRPATSWAPYAWSEIVVINWTWHNPPGFGNDASSYLLQIDRLTIRLELVSIYRAVRNREAVNVDLLQVEGVRFKTKRNREAALNLWEALDLPDADVNVSVLAKKAQQYGAIQDMKVVKPLPAVATAATRNASRRRTSSTTSTVSGSVAVNADPSPGCWPCGWLASKWRGRSLDQPVVHRSYYEHPIGHPERRPRWGVPMRFDIQQVVALQVELWIFDLLTLDQRRRFIEPGDTKLNVPSFRVTRDTLEAGDERRAGRGDAGDGGDGVRGVYLGELVWVLIAQLLPNAFQNSPTVACRNAICAMGQGTRDATVVAGAKVLEFALDLNRFIGCGAYPGLGHGVPEPVGCCSLHVHLFMGTGMSNQGKRVNVHARFELYNPSTWGMGPQTEAVDRAESMLKLWTKTPLWNQHLYLGPVSSVHSTLRVVCFHRKTRHATEPHTGSSCDRFLGEAFLPLDTLLVQDRAIGRDGEIVGWFPLSSRGSGNTHRRGGRIKLGLRLLGAEHLPDAAPYLKLMSRTRSTSSVRSPRCQRLLIAQRLFTATRIGVTATRSKAAVVTTSISNSVGAGARAIGRAFFRLRHRRALKSRNS